METVLLVEQATHYIKYFPYQPELFFCMQYLCLVNRQQKVM